MYANEILVDVRNHPLTFGKDIFIYERRADGTVGVYHPQPDGTMLVESFQPGTADTPAPTFTLDNFVLEKLVELLIDSGIRPKDVSVVEGKLEAQTKHLEDLRHLLKLPTNGRTQE